MTGTTAATFAHDARSRTTDDDAMSRADASRLLAALDDADCRAVLGATTRGPRSASELSEACDIPLSTLYRKLELLTDVGFLDERVRLSSAEKHPNEYVRRIDAITVSIGGEGDVTLDVRGVDGDEERPVAAQM